jgi:hypothetical protein
MLEMEGKSSGRVVGFLERTLMVVVGELKKKITTSIITTDG